MAMYPGAEQFNRTVGRKQVYNPDCPWRIIWMTSEAKLRGVVSTHDQQKTYPHFSVDETKVYQYFDTTTVASCLSKYNRQHCIQVELIGSCRSTKSKALLQQAAALARWIEKTHGVPSLWPLGHPQFTNKSTCDEASWMETGGHYGRSQVPGEKLYDPGLINDIGILMGTTSTPAVS